MFDERWKQKTHFPAVAMPDKAGQPNAITGIMQFHRDLGIHRDGRNLAIGKFNEHALHAQVKNPPLTYRALPTSNRYRKHLVEFH
jgi:hypothetical protein